MKDYHKKSSTLLVESVGRENRLINECNFHLYFLSCFMVTHVNITRSHYSTTMWLWVIFKVIEDFLYIFSCFSIVVSLISDPFFHVTQQFPTSKSPLIDSHILGRLNGPRVVDQPRRVWSKRWTKVYFFLRRKKWI